MSNSNIFWTIVAVISFLSLLVAFPVVSLILGSVFAFVITLASIALDVDKYGETNLDDYDFPFHVNLIYRLTKFNNWLNSLDRF